VEIGHRVQLPAPIPRVLEKKEAERKEREKAERRTRERKNRDSFNALLREHLKDGTITPRMRWKVGVCAI
jgi:hypothetical protein